MCTFTNCFNTMRYIPKLIQLMFVFLSFSEMLNISWRGTVNFSLLSNTSSEICNPYEPGVVSAIEQALMATAYAVLFSFSFFGNILVIFIFYKRYGQLQTTTSCFIVNMAVSDLVAPICVIPRRIKNVYVCFASWPLGGVLGDLICRVGEYVDEVSTSVSALSMVLIAAERFWAIVFPMKRPLISKNTTLRYVLLTWFFSMLFYLYYFFANRLVYRKDGSPSCDYGIPEVFDTWEDLWRVDRLSLLVTFVLIPFVLMAAFYSAIIINLCRSNEVASHLSVREQSARRRRHKRMTLMLLTVVVVFFASYLPYYVYFFKQYYSLGRMESCRSIRQLYLAARYMSYIYTGLNPLIYYAFNKSYRRGFHQLLHFPWICFRICCPKSSFRHVFVISPSIQSVEGGSFRQTKVLGFKNEKYTKKYFCRIKILL